MQSGQRFIQTARQAGFRESGATAGGPAPQRVMVGIRCSIRLEVLDVAFSGCCPVGRVPMLRRRCRLGQESC